MSQNIYDDPSFFEGYSRLQRSRLGLAGAPEWPVLQAMLPSMAGLRVLDLGCGFGWFARWVRQAGAVSVVGVDLSERMLLRARAETSDAVITYLRANIEHLTLPASSFDLVYSSLTLHYVEDLSKLLRTLHASLSPNGRFVFSVEHPIFSAPLEQKWQVLASGSKIWPLNSYLVEGQRVTDWITPGVTKQHRTIAAYVNGLIDAGFRLLRLEEWGPSEAQIQEHPEWADEIHRPPFLLMSAQA
ncbi:MAG TPA: class I SAM-dependent methyltransferase [Casimicrobiaceae bacterium]|nr:class I SAM-dependent methyltransferase [Casimicrobiaceae bacterium]